MQMIPHRWKQDGRFKADEIVWREDMDSFVLDLMRRRCVNLLKYLSGLSAAYIAACESYEDIQKKHQPGAAMWFGQPFGCEVSGKGEEAPPLYAMIKYKASSHIPVYNMPALLGPEHLHQLRNSGKPFKEPFAAIKEKRNTLEIQLQLWKLMGYMAHDVDAE